MGTSKTAETAEFWEDDAAAIAEREQIQRTGQRMPAAVKESGKQRPKQQQAPEEYEPFTDIDDAAASRKRWIRGSILAAAAAAVIAGLQWYRAPVITLNEFNKLNIGMNEDDCNRIVGTPGQRIFDMKTAALFDGQLPKQSHAIQWTNKDGSTAAAAFFDGQTISINQIGLR